MSYSKHFPWSITILYSFTFSVRLSVILVNPLCKRRFSLILFDISFNFSSSAPVISIVKLLNPLVILATIPSTSDTRIETSSHSFTNFLISSTTFAVLGALSVSCILN